MASQISHEFGDGNVVFIGPNGRVIFLPADVCVVDDDDVCQRGDHPTDDSDCRSHEEVI